MAVKGQPKIACTTSGKDYRKLLAFSTSNHSKKDLLVSESICMGIYSWYLANSFRAFGLFTALAPIGRATFFFFRMRLSVSLQRSMAHALHLRAGRALAAGSGFRQGNSFPAASLSDLRLLTPLAPIGSATSSSFGQAISSITALAPLGTVGGGAGRAQDKKESASPTEDRPCHTPLACPGAARTSEDTIGRVAGSVRKRKARPN
eukprot:SM000339S12959  [mRNA]  locus=s339:83048:84136:+ [translate_table: standard]